MLNIERALQVGVPLGRGRAAAVGGSGGAGGSIAGPANPVGRRSPAALPGGPCPVHLRDRTADPAAPEGRSTTGALLRQEVTPHGQACDWNDAAKRIVLLGATRGGRVHNYPLLQE